MKYTTILMMAILLAATHAITGTAAAEAPLFEDTHVVKLPVKTYGYRNMPGDIIALKDGRLLLAYTRMDGAGNADGSIAARYSSDQGKTWAEEFILIPANTPKYDLEVYCHPSFVRTANDQILVTYIYRSSMEPFSGTTIYAAAPTKPRPGATSLSSRPTPATTSSTTTNCSSSPTGGSSHPVNGRLGARAVTTRAM